MKKIKRAALAIAGIPAKYLPKKPKPRSGSKMAENTSQRRIEYASESKTGFLNLSFWHRYKKNAPRIVPAPKWAKVDKIRTEKSADVTDEKSDKPVE
jgi:hypothetical protein